MFRPVKFLQINLPSLTPSGFVDIPPIGMVPYQWSTTLVVNTQSHSSQETPNPFFYDGNDVVVGDCIFSMGQGRLLEIVSISAQDSGNVSCILEDIDSENALTDPTQNLDGALTTGDGYLFEVRDGFPILYPIPDALVSTLPQYFAASIYGRFFNNKRYKLIEVSQASHGFAVGDGIYLAADGKYYKALANSPTTAKLIGTVRNIDVPDKFLYQPVGPYLDGVNMPAGDPGSYVYLSDTVAGGWTTVEPADPAFRIPAWIKVDSDTGVYIGGDNTPILASQVGFDNSVADLPGGPQSVQAAIEVLASVGVQGAQGAQGTYGPQGDMGVQGVYGSQGDVGVQGSGTQGPQGQGFQGVQGPAGSGAAGYYSIPLSLGDTVITLPFSYIMGNNELCYYRNGLYQAISGDYTETTTNSITLAWAITAEDNHLIIKKC